MCWLGWLEEVRGSDEWWAGDTDMMKAKWKMGQVEDAQREGTALRWKVPKAHPVNGSP